MKTRCLFLIAVLLGVCACNTVAKPVVPERRAGRGEGCLTTNDCKEPLLCIADHCLDQELSFEPTSKVCVAADCISDSDCCRPLSKDEQSDCAEYKKQCEQSRLCGTYEALCTCESKCVNHSCTETLSECTSSDDCFRGTCKNQKCVECSKDADCGKGYVCEDSLCRAGCQRDEACGALQVCKTGRCVDRDCESDRECAFLLGMRDAVCRKGACGIPCKEDAQCAWVQRGELTTCNGGLCKFVGCETNADCAALQLYSWEEGQFSLCLSQAEANKVR